MSPFDELYFFLPRFNGRSIWVPTPSYNFTGDVNEMLNESVDHFLGIL